MEKSPDAFRTISEVAESLETPAHVLRFWESRFPQIRPVKRAGGRRYYRPADVALLTGIKRLLHEEGMTIRGVQKILREQGVRFVSGLPENAAEAPEAQPEPVRQSSPEPALPIVETGRVLPLPDALTGKDRLQPPPARQEPNLPSAPPRGSDDATTGDLFDEPRNAASPEPETAGEAPMAVWVEEDAGEAAAESPPDEPTPLPAEVRVTRIGSAASTSAASAVEETATGLTLAARLRRLSADALSPSDRSTITILRARARSLRDRLGAPLPSAG